MESSVHSVPWPDTDTPPPCSEHPIYQETEELENKICTLAANINALTYQLLILIAEYDERELWARGGNRSCAHWLNWKCGIGMSAGREKVRVARALKQLPAVGKALEAGKLSYSKARAITRIGTPENEDYLLNIAEHGTASHLDKLVNQFRQAKLRHERADERRAAAEHCDQRLVEYYWDEEGMLVIKARLPPEQGAVVLKSLEIAVDALHQDRPLQSPLDVEVVDGVAQWDPLDEDVAEDGYYHPTVEDGLCKARKNRRADALVIMAETHLQHATSTSSCADRFQVSVLIDHDILTDNPADHGADQPNGHCHLEHDVALPLDTVRRLCCDSSVIHMEDSQGEVLSVGRKTRVVPPAMRRALKKRDQGCRWPGCDASRFVEAHHVHHWADGGETSLDNLLLLCRHHHRLMHEGGFSIVNTDNEFQFYTTEGAHIPDAAPWTSASTTPDSDTESLGDPVDEKTGWCWGGDRMDWDLAVELLCDRDKYFRKIYGHGDPHAVDIHHSQ